MNEIQKNAQGIIPGVAREVLAQKLIPLSPLAEQKRIAARLDELLGKLDALNASR